MKTKYQLLDVFRWTRVKSTHLFNLFKLMDTEDTEDVTTGRTSFLAETSRVPSVLDGELLVRLVEPFLRVEGRDRLFRGRNEVLFSIFVRSFELVEAMS